MFRLAVLRHLRGARVGCPPRLTACGVGLLALAASHAVMAGTTEATAPLDLTKWEYFEQCPLPAEPGAGEYCDLILPTSVFDKARLDLGDLRLCDVAGSEVPYALRVRSADYRDESFQAREFNRSTGENKSTELSLDLEANPQQHNQVDVRTAGIGFRRRAELDGSDDGQQWRRLVEADLVHFKSSKTDFDEHRLTYPPSRFRYLRLRVFPDAAVDRESVEILDVSVHRKIEVPGEFVTLPARVGPREPVRTNGAPGSAWILDLGGNHVPCQRIDVEVADDDFARPYVVEASGRAENGVDGMVVSGGGGSDYVFAGGPENGTAPAIYEADSGFTMQTQGLWRRLAGERHQPLKAEFQEVRASRLRLLVTDNRNPPLDVQSVTFTAPVRQLVFAHTPALSGPLRLYFGNPRGTPPHYDLERNLPAELIPPPARLQLQDRQENPGYLPEPKALTERLPWLIYVVLGGAGALLGAILVNLGRAAVAQHDAITAA